MGVCACVCVCVCVCACVCVWVCGQARLVAYQSNTKPQELAGKLAPVD